MLNPKSKGWFLEQHQLRRNCYICKSATDIPRGIDSFEVLRSLVLYYKSKNTRAGTGRSNTTFFQRNGEAKDPAWN